MILDHLNGAPKACVEVESHTLDIWEMSGRVMCRPFTRMNRIEQRALKLCRGRILDIGAGSGTHTLYLQQRKQDVTAIDISPGCVAAMQQQGVKQVRHQNLFDIKAQQFDTLLMLMNGLGICGSIEGLNLFFQFIPEILEPGGQVLADSTDLAHLYDVDHPGDDYYGETCFIMSYQGIRSDPFDWLYIDFETLEYYAEFHGLPCEKLLGDKTGKFLARITLSGGDLSGG